MKENRVGGRERKLYHIWFAAGLVFTAFMLIPYLILGQDAVFTYHDQLDGEMLAYILQAKHLFRGDILPEFLNGADKTALTMPAPGMVLLFLTGNNYGALAFMQLAGSLCGYVGMYLLVWQVCGKSCRPAAAAAALLYAYLPFLPVYGLSQYGIPLLVWCFLQLEEGAEGSRPERTIKWFCFAYIGVYTLCSSLVLCGFGVLLLLLVRILQKGGRQKRLWSAFALMLLLYIAVNYRLLGQMLMGGGGLSHKAEYVLTPEAFVTGFLRGFLEGGQHSQDFHKWILAGAVLTAAAALAFGAWRERENRKLLQGMGFCVGLNFLLAFTAALWNSSAGIMLRTHLEALGAFQVQRLLWLAPCFWYLLLGCTLILAWKMAAEGFRRKEKERFRVFGTAAVSVCCAAALTVTGVSVLLGSSIKPNIQKLRKPDYGLLSYRDYYALGVMEQVEAFIRETTGKEQEEYRVASLGVDPAAALYHGFYCLDGYSNNYSLEYKHAFRRVIAPELQKSDYLTAYFDEWGNRCYLMSAETPGYYTIEKNGFYFQDYALDTEAFLDMGGVYLLSAAYIANADEAGLVLLREEPFETEDSYYRIFLYGIA